MNSLIKHTCKFCNSPYYESHLCDQIFNDKIYRIRFAGKYIKVFEFIANQKYKNYPYLTIMVDNKNYIKNIQYANTCPDTKIFKYIVYFKTNDCLLEQADIVINFPMQNIIETSNSIYDCFTNIKLIELFS